MDGDDTGFLDVGFTVVVGFLDVGLPVVEVLDVGLTVVGFLGLTVVGFRTDGLFDVDDGRVGFLDVGLDDVVVVEGLDVGRLVGRQ
jgi:hypothetical protein